MNIPKISDERLLELSERIKPVIRSKSGELAYIAPCDLRREAFTWSPKITEKADGLVDMAQVKTLHTFGFYGFFKPSIAEVLAQIPEEYLGHVCAFETNGPANIQEANEDSAALNSGFHVATTTLYRK